MRDGLLITVYKLIIRIHWPIRLYLIYLLWYVMPEGKITSALALSSIIIITANNVGHFIHTKIRRRYD